MLGMFYAYTEEYKHNDFFKDKTNLCNMYKIKLRYICCEMNVFFSDLFINHLPKIHRSVLRKVAIDLLYFETFMTSIYEKS